MFRIENLSWPAGVQKVGTAGTAGNGQTTFGWKKWDLDDKIIGHIITRANKFYSDKLDIWIFNKWYNHFVQYILDTLSN